MPVHRSPDGKIIEEKTGRHVDADQATDRVGQSPPPPPGNRTTLEKGRLDAPTRVVGEDRPAAAADNEQTRLVGGRRRKEDEKRRQEQAQSADAMDDPVVGWLVVVAGPGKGRALQLGYGANTLGRGNTDRVSLNFGDERISRSGHATVTYDPRGRRFYLQHGGGTNLTYLGEQPVLAPTELPALSHIILGDTTLRFVPLCGEDFDWQDTGENDG